MKDQGIPVGLKEGRGPGIGFRIPPTAGIGGAAAGAEDRLVHPVQLRPILHAILSHGSTLLYWATGHICYSCPPPDP